MHRDNIFDMPEFGNTNKGPRSNSQKNAAEFGSRIANTTYQKTRTTNGFLDSKKNSQKKLLPPKGNLPPLKVGVRGTMVGGTASERNPVWTKAKAP